MNEIEKLERETYRAYITTSQIGGVRTPIQGERIVIDLGSDDFGNARELSIELVKRLDSPDAVVAYAIVEPLPNKRLEYLPTLSCKPECAVNAVRLIVAYKRRAEGDDGKQT